MSVPLDDGFFRRQCPTCDRQFKWHSGPTENRPEDAVDPPFYHCPYCNEPAGPDDWWTHEQLEYATQTAAGPLMRAVVGDLEDMTKGLAGDLISVSVEADGAQEPPEPLIEPSDMMAVEPPCHPWEPVKVADDWREPLHCLVCGSKFAV